MKILIFSLIIFSFIFTGFLQPAYGAEDGWGFEIVPEGCKGKAPTCEDGDDDPTKCCGLNAFIAIAINLFNIILALTGSAALLMFTYGGVMFILSAGNQERVSKAKTIFTNSVIGLAIVLGSWVIVTFIEKVLKGTPYAT